MTDLSSSRSYHYYISDQDDQYEPKPATEKMATSALVTLRVETHGHADPYSPIILAALLLPSVNKPFTLRTSRYSEDNQDKPHSKTRKTNVLTAYPASLRTRRRRSLTVFTMLRLAGRAGESVHTARKYLPHLPRHHEVTSTGRATSERLLLAIRGMLNERQG